MLSEFKTTRYFIQIEVHEGAPRLMGIDENRKKVSLSLAQGITQRLLEIFNGSPKAVERSSGGMILVTPIQLVLSHKPSGLQEIRIKVTFKDLERDARGQILSKKIVSVAKTVLPEEIKEGFSTAQQPNNNFVADFGLGIIPIHVIHYYQDKAGTEWAVFVRHDDLEKSLWGNSLEDGSICLYEIPKAMLRLISPISNNKTKDFQWARRHVKNLEFRNETIIPKQLLVMREVLLPAQLSLPELQRFLLSTFVTRPLNQNDRAMDAEEKVTRSFPLMPMNENMGE